MKKILSLLLVISLVVGMSLPVLAVENENIDIQLYNIFKNSSIGQSIQNMDVDSLVLLNSIMALNEANFLNKVIENYTGVLNQNQNNKDVRDFVKANYALNKEDVLDLGNILKTWVSGNSNDAVVLLGLFLKVTEGGDLDPVADKEIVDYIGELREAVTSELTELINKWESQVLISEYSKTQFALAIMDKFFENTLVTENSDGSLVFSVKGSETDVEADLVELEDTYLNDTVAKLSEQGFDYYRTLTDLVNQLNLTVKTIVEDTNLTNDDVKNIVKAFGINFNAYVAPSRPEDKEETEPEVNVPEDKEEPVEVTLPEEAVEVKETEDGVTAEVSEENIDAAISAIENLDNEDEQDVEVVIEIPNVEGEDNVTLDLSASSIEKLSEAGANLIIKSGDVEFSIPADALDLGDVAEGANVSISFNKLNETDTNKVNEIADNNKSENAKDSKTLKVLDFSITTTGSNNNEKKISKFNKPLKLKVDVKDVDAEEYDKLAVYYIDEDNNTIEFVGGKIINGVLVFKTNHFSKYALVSFDITYDDIANHWSKAYVESMSAKNVVNGYTDGTFKPAKSITRAEFTKLVVNALELDLLDYDGKFTDVNSNEWFAKYIATANKAGIINGYTDETFKPNKEITRLEMAAILSRSLKTEITEEEISDILAKFIDSADIKDWGKDELAKAVKAGLLVGNANGKFMPNGSTSRSEAATAVYRLFNK